MKHVESHPLHWPVGWRRSERRQRSQFKTSFASARDGLLDEIRLLGGRDPIISTNIETYQRGGRDIPYANQARPADPGVAVYFTRAARQRVLACDRYQSVGENLQAIRKTIEALRGIERWGSSELLDRTFQGFAALPESIRTRSWWEVLGVERHWTLEKIEAHYRSKALNAHPDRRGGSTERMAELNRAIHEARAERGRT